jgi:hypothetical protein
LTKTQSRCLAFHRIDIEIIQQIKGKCCLGLFKARRKEAGFEELKKGGWSMIAFTPENTMGKYSICIEDDQGSMETRSGTSIRT